MKRFSKIFFVTLAASIVGSVSVHAATLSAPTSVTVTFTDCQHNLIKWSESSTVTGFAIYRNTSSTVSTNNPPAGTTSGTTKQFTDVVLPSTPSTSVQYWYVVVATNGTSRSAPSSPSATGGVQPECPTDPSNLFVVQVQCSCHALKITFTDNSSDETGFTLQRATSSTFSGATSILLPAHAGTGTVTYFDGCPHLDGCTQTPLDPSSTYWYRVWANRTTGNSGTNTYCCGTAPTACASTVNTSPCPQ